MKLHLLHHHPGTPRLLLIFAGWACESDPFAGIAPEGYDVAVVHSYTHPDIPAGSYPAGLDARLEPLGYTEVCVLAWSYGVAVASRFLASTRLPIGLAVAVAGTMHPVDAELGIPPRVYALTLRSLSPAALQEFWRRAGCPAPATEPDIAALRADLEWVGSQEPCVTDRWDVVYITGADRIVPPAAQRRQWQGHPCVRHLPDSPHTPDFRAIVASTLVSKARVARRFAKAAATYDTEASLCQEPMARRLLALWREVDPSLASGRDVVEAGCGTGVFTRLYLEASGAAPRSLLLWDLHACREDVTEADAELAIRELPDASADVLAAACCLQWFNSPAQWLRQAQRVLRPGGLVVLSTFGSATLRELSHLTGRSLRLPDIPDLRRLLPEGLGVAACDSGFITLTFPSVMAMLRHLKHTGVNALAPASGADVRRVARSYPTAPDGSCSLSYQPVYMILEKTP